MQGRGGAPGKHALIVGIDDYRRGIPPLTSAVADARAIAGVLAELHGYRVTLLVDAEASLTGIRAALADVVGAAGPRDRVLFYFAGHGVAEDADGDDDGPRGYFIPQDADKQRTDTFLAMAEVRSVLAQPHVSQLMLLLDCCFAGSFQWSSTRDLRVQRPKLYKERYERYLREPAWQAIASSACDERALDVVAGKVLGERAAGHSPFAAACIEGLRSAADLGIGGRSGDGIVLASELYLFIEDMFFRHEQITGRRQQTPSLWSFGGPTRAKGQFVFELRGADPSRLPSARALDEASNPYRGLSPYGEASAGLYFGREAATRALCEAVQRQALTVVVGASGTGKSSLVAAGLLPKLRGSASPAYTILPAQRPESAPLAALERLVAQLGAPPATPLADAVAAFHAREPDTHLVVIVDQLEELVTQTTDAAVRAAFLRAIADATARGAGWLHVVMTLRLDFEAHFAELLAGRGEGSPRFLIPHMSREELRQVIEGPASERVLFFEPPGLVDALIDEVIDAPGALPLLSFTLSEMYRVYVQRARDDRTLRAEDYDSLGGVSGALARRADEVYDGLAEAEQTTMRRLLLRMVVPGESARRPVPEAELQFADAAEDARVRSVCARLVDARLAASGKDALGRGYIEPAHDKLVTGWPRLQAFIDAERDTMMLMHALGQAAAQWAAGGRASGLLWDDDPRRPQALALRRGEPARFNRVEQEFVDRSHQRRTRFWISVASAVGGAIVGLSVVAAIALVQRGEAIAAQAEAELQRRAAVTAQGDAEREAAHAKDEATRARDQARMVAIREAARDPTIQAVLLREVERPAQTRQWRQLAADLRQDALADVVLAAGGEVVSVTYAPDGRTILGRTTDRAIVWRSDGEGSPVTLAGHTGPLTAAVFSPDGSRIATASRDGTVRIWRADGAGESMVLAGHAAAVTSVAFAPDGGRVVTASADGTARVWRIDGSGEPVRLVGHAGEVVSAAFSPDGGRIVTASEDRTAKVWRADGTGTPITLTGHRDALTHAMFSPNGSQVATASLDLEARIWRADGGGEPLILRGHENNINDLVFSPRGDAVLTASMDGAARLWKRGRVDPALLQHETAVYAGAFAPDGRRVVTVGYDGKARIWPVDGDDAPTILAGHQKAVRSVAYAPDGRRLVTGSSDGTARIWRAEQLVEPVILREPIEPGPEEQGAEDQDIVVLNPRINSAEFAPDGRRIVTSSELAVARIWPADGRGAPVVLRGHTRSVVAAGFSADGSRIVTRAEDDTARVWRADGQGDALWVAQHQAPVTAAALSADGARVVTAAVDGAVVVWTIDGRSVTLGHRGAPVRAAAFSPDGGRVVSVSDDGNATIWRSDGSGEPVVRVGPGGPVRLAAFSPDGARVVTVTDATARVWRLERPDAPVLLRGHAEAITAVGFSADGGRVVTGSQDDTARIWRADGAGEPVVLTGHAGDVHAAAFSPDGGRVVTASSDRTAAVWSADGAGEPIVLRGHTGSVQAASFAPDGLRVVTVADDSTARVWSLHSVEQEVASLWRATDHCLPADERVARLGEREEDARAGFAACRRRIAGDDDP